jgi:acetamidase/formamidase
MPQTLFKIDLTKPMYEQELVGHNRWHPDIPAVVTVNPGDVFRIECKDWTDGQIKNDDDPSDIRWGISIFPREMARSLSVGRSKWPATSISTSI